jgi:DNA adenine methylase
VVKENSNEINEMVKEVSDKISEISKREKDEKITISEAKTERGLIYYEWRNKDRNNGLNSLSNLERAFRFLIVNQLAFNGMRRFNSRGEFNIPYGNYKTFNPIIKEEHINKLKKTQIFCGSYKDVMLNNDTKNTFIYIDPPYTREFKEYSHENIFGKKQQIELFETFKGMKNASVMIIINKDDFTTELYKEFIKDEYDLKYSTNIKNRYDNSVKHLIITNY